MGPQSHMQRCCCHVGWDSFGPKYDMCLCFDSGSICVLVLCHWFGGVCVSVQLYWRSFSTSFVYNTVAWRSSFDFTPPWLHCIALYVSECDKIFCMHVCSSSVWWSAFDSTPTRQCTTWMCCNILDIVRSSVYMYVDGCGDTVHMHKHRGILMRLSYYTDDMIINVWFHVIMVVLTLAFIGWKLGCV